MAQPAAEQGPAVPDRAAAAPLASVAPRRRRNRAGGPYSNEKIRFQSLFMLMTTQPSFLASS